MTKRNVLSLARRRFAVVPGEPREPQSRGDDLMKAAAISCRGLTKRYGATAAIDDLTFEVEPGEAFGFLGANGAGKTTTIRLLLDLIRPTRGAASVFGFDSRHQGLEARSRIGYLPGDMPIYPDLTGRAYLDYLSAISTRPTAPATRDHLLERFEVSPADLTRKMRDDSHGTKRKFGVVQALMTDAPLVILDEPTSGLDPLMIEVFVEVIGELKRRGTTVFLSSHILAEVDRLCDRIAIVRQGQLIDVQSLDALRKNAPRRVTVDFLTPVVSQPPGGVRSLEVRPRQWRIEITGPIGPFLAEMRDLPIADVTIEPFQLEDYLLSLYAKRS
jgi:ABC-type multidrug transport system ATPase subunit